MKRLIARVLTVLLTVAVLLLSAVELGALEPPSSSQTDSQYDYECDDTYEYLDSDGGVTINGVKTPISGEAVIPSEYRGSPVTKISDYAFAGCTMVTSIVIPDTVTQIGDGAFEDTAYYKNTNNWDNGVLYIGKHLIKATEAVSGDVTVRPDTLTIASGAFRRCTSLNSVTIPDSVVTLGQGAFSGCSYLTAVRLGKGLKLIDHSAFWECTKLSEINIPDSVSEIGSLAFHRCEELTSVVLPKSLTSIGYEVFSDCKRLSSVKVPDGVVNIGYNAFSGCEMLRSINIPDGVLSIGNNAFANCGLLTSLTLPDSVTQIGDYAFNGCRSLTSINLPDSVIKIGKGVFNCCSSLKTVKLPQRVTSISEEMFSNCTELTEIAIPDNIITIEKNAFDSCMALDSVTVPENVALIGESAFEGCNTLSSITLPDTAIVISAKAFYNTEYYNDRNNWRDGVLYIGKHLIEANGVSKPDAVAQGTLTVAEKAFTNCPLLNNVVVPEGVLRIGENAFSECKNLDSVTLPDSITAIGRDAFSDTAFYNDKMSNWQDDALYIGKHLIKVKETASNSYTVKEGTLTIADNALTNCYGLLSVTVPDGVKHIGDGAFSRCTSLKSVTLPDSVESIGENAFAGSYYYMYDNNWEAGALYIGRHLIEAKVYGDGNFVIKDGTLTVGEAAFKSGTQLKTVTLSKSLRSINSKAFADCTALETVYYRDNTQEHLTVGTGNYYLVNAKWEFANTVAADKTDHSNGSSEARPNNGAWVIIIVAIAVVAFVTTVVLVAVKKKK